MKRPLGITMLALALGIFGVIGLFLALADLGLLPIETLQGSDGTGFNLGAFLTLLLSLGYLAVAWGLWKLLAWGRSGAVLLLLLSILSNIASLVSGNLSAIVGILILAIVVLYLVLDKEVEASFGKLRFM